jgi:homoserine O-acetyltransferase/O-succinyltransferase
LAAARMSALLTYRSRNSFESRFSRKTIPSLLNTPDAPDLSHLTDENTILHNEGNKFRLHQPKISAQQDGGTGIYSAQSYLRYQGDKFVERFDANCYISITRKIDSHDVFRGREENVLEGLDIPILVIGNIYYSFL